MTSTSFTAPSFGSSNFGTPSYGTSVSTPIGTPTGTPTRPIRAARPSLVDPRFRSQSTYGPTRGVSFSVARRESSDTESSRSLMAPSLAHTRQASPTRVRQPSLPWDMTRRPTIGHIRSLSMADSAKGMNEFPRLCVWDPKLLENACITGLGTNGELRRGTVSDDTLKKMGVLERALEIEENGEKKEEDDAPVPDEEMQKNQKRPHLVTHAWLVAIAAGLVVTLELWCIADLIGETVLDGKWSRWALVCTRWTRNLGHILTRVNRSSLFPCFLCSVSSS